MGRARLIVLCAVVVSMLACSRSGRRGTGADEGEGNIPLAQEGGPLKDINFDFDSSALSDMAQASLRQNASWLKENGKSVTIEGHCDERGTVEYNLALGQRRAQATQDYLRTLGVRPDSMSTISYGEELPLDTGHDESAWAKNRRAHFAVK